MGGAWFLVHWCLIETKMLGSGAGVGAATAYLSGRSSRIRLSNSVAGVKARRVKTRSSI